MSEYEFDNIDTEVGGPRLDFEFSGTRRYPLSLDPAEHRGDTAAVSGLILKTLLEIDPAASFFQDEIDLAAEAVVNANEQ
jgi:hypothetical protein